MFFSKKNKRTKGNRETKETKAKEEQETKSNKKQKQKINTEKKRKTTKLQIVNETNFLTRERKGEVKDQPLLLSNNNNDHEENLKETM
jgi:uncharacterized protein YdaU (DUF1376 family)